MARKEEWLQVRLTAEQKRALEDTATSAGTSLSGFVRDAIEKATREVKDRQALEVLSLNEIEQARRMDISPSEYLRARDNPGYEAWKAAQ